MIVRRAILAFSPPLKSFISLKASSPLNKNIAKALRISVFVRLGCRSFI
jgi:hypothetical protein